MSRAEELDALHLEDLAARVREKREAAILRPPGCPDCRCSQLRDGEHRHDDGHACGCALRGAARCQGGNER